MKGVELAEKGLLATLHLGTTCENHVADGGLAVANAVIDPVCNYQTSGL